MRMSLDQRTSPKRAHRNPNHPARRSRRKIKRRRNQRAHLQGRVKTMKKSHRQASRSPKQTAARRRTKPVIRKKLRPKVVLSPRRRVL
jgi:hypothetical protein